MKNRYNLNLNHQFFILNIMKVKIAGMIVQNRDIWYAFINIGENPLDFLNKIVRSASRKVEYGM